MKSIIFYMFFFFVSYFNITAQSLSVFDVDTSSFPTIKAKFYAFDAAGNQITNLSASDFEVKENGTVRTVTDVSCPSPKPALALSCVLTFDVSGSMCGDPIELEKRVASHWIDNLLFSPSECGITSFSDISYLNSDFTTKKQYLQDRINTLSCMDGTNYDEAFLNDFTGAISIAKTGKHKKIIIFLSDGQPNSEPQTSKIIQDANNYGITIYSIIVNLPAPQCIKDISEQTGGIFFENVENIEEIKSCYIKVLKLAQEGEPCTIEWQHEVNCQSELINLEIILSEYHLNINLSYISPAKFISRLIFSPSCIVFKNAEPGTIKVTTVTITALNGNFHISTIVTNNPNFSIDKSSFDLTNGQSTNFNLSYLPIDSSYTCARFTFENNTCPAYYYASGGFSGIKPKVQTLKLVNPNGGEKFFIGGDTIINWKGIPESDPVKLEYSFDNESTWKTIIDKTYGLNYYWKNIPRPVSDQCKVRIKQLIDIDNNNDLPGNLILTFNEHFQSVNSLSWSPDGSKIASSSTDTRAISWDPITGQISTIFGGHTLTVNKVSWSPDGSKVGTASDDRTAIIWDANNGNIISKLIGHTDGLTDIIWNPDGNRVATLSMDNIAIIWDALTGVKLISLSGSNNNINKICWSHDGNSLITTCFDNSIILYDASTGSIIKKFIGHKNYITDLTWSPDGKYFVTSSSDSTAIIWDVLTCKVLYTLNGHKDVVNCANWSPDGKRIITMSNDMTGIIWSTFNGTKSHLISGFNGSIYKTSWSPDGSRIAIMECGNVVSIWNANSGTRIYKLNGHKDFISDICWNLNGDLFATSSYDKTVKIWSLDNSNLELQEDKSDSLFSIVAPQAQSNDIDMRQCLVGSTKDSLITGYINNVGSYKFRVDSIYFTGADASYFRLIGGLPKFELAPGTGKTSEFSFTPNRIGLHTAIINIITQSDTLRQNITGEGVQHQLEIVNKLINFGVVPIGNNKDSLQAATIKNVSNFPITITDSRQGGPNNTDFSILSNGGSFTLAPGETRNMDLRFAPAYIGRTSGSIEFYYNGVGSPAVMQLFGQGLGGSVKFDDDSAFVGDKVKLRLKLLNNIKPKSQSLVTSFKAKLSYNPTLLTMTDQRATKNLTLLKETAEVKAGWDGSSQLLDEFDAIAGLGNSDSTVLVIEDFNWLDDNGNIVNFDTETTNGMFHLLGICKEGGTRLLNPYGKVQLMLAKPNPAGDEVEIGYELVESGRTQLYIIDMNGKRIKTLFDKEISSFGVNSEKLNTSEIPSGSYLVILQTPTERQSIKLEVVK